MTGQLQDSDSDAPTVGNPPANSMTLPSFKSLNLNTKFRRPQPMSNPPVVNSVPVIINEPANSMTLPSYKSLNPHTEFRLPQPMSNPPVVKSVPVIINKPVIVRNINF